MVTGTYYITNIFQYDSKNRLIAEEHTCTYQDGSSSTTHIP